MNQTLPQYLRSAETALDNRNCRAIANILSIRDPHVYRLAQAMSTSNLENVCTQHLSDMHGSLLLTHMYVVLGQAAQNYGAAFEAQLRTAEEWLRLSKDWNSESLVVMWTLMRDLKALAGAARRASTQGGGRSGGGGGGGGGSGGGGGGDEDGENDDDKLNQTAAFFRKVFAAFVKCGDGADSKKFGLLHVVNSLLSVYFQTSNLSQCNSLLMSVENGRFPSFDSFPISHVVTYKFYTGRLALFDNKFREANEALTFAFDNCTARHPKNKRLILLYLLPVRLMRGQAPTRFLLEKYQLTQFVALVGAVTSGNVRALNDELEANQEFFVRYGLYLALEKLINLTYCNLFRRIYNIMGQMKQLPIIHFVDGLAACGVVMDLDEVECLLANFIHQGLLKGYLSHSQRKLVTGKDPFRPFSTVQT